MCCGYYELYLIQYYAACVYCVYVVVVLATCLLLYVISIMFNAYVGLNTVVTYLVN